MSIQQQHRLFSNRKGWITTGSNADYRERITARNELIVRDFDKGTDTETIARQHKLNEEYVKVLLRAEGRTVSCRIAPSGASPAAIGGSIMGRSVQAESSRRLLKAILRHFVRNDILPATMTLQQLRDRCRDAGVECP